MTMALGKDTLIVRHLPACLTDSEKVEFLEYFGAKEVRVMPNLGRMKHSAFAVFKDSDDARKAIIRLHQVNIYGSVLSVEIAKELPAHQNNDTTHIAIVRNDESRGEPNQVKHQSLPKEDTDLKTISTQKTVPASPIASHLGLHYPSDPGIKYRYPPANGDVLLNICSALATVPKFYVQVLHLMNKMHLLPPFSPVNTISPLLTERLREIWPSIPQFPEGSGMDKLEVVEMSESESEYESGESEGEGILKSLDMVVPERVVKSRKRKLKKPSDNLTHKKKIRKLLPKFTPIESESKTVTNVSDAFDDSELASFQKHIEIKVQALPTDKNVHAINPPVELSDNGFGKLQPTGLSETVCGGDIEERSEDKILKDFITLKQLSKGRLSEKEMKSSTLFQNYKKGDPNCRLYIKNLSKRVTEKDLEFLYGSFVNYTNENETNMFDIQLLKQGRMKGQAFVGFSSVDTATAALNATNGYQLMNKPMVVHYARSKKPKEQSQD